MISNLPFLQSLLGSLSGQETLTPAERELAMQRQQLEQQAGAAQSAYGQAAAAPAPGYLPGDTFVPQLLGALASVVGQSPRYAEQAEEGIAQKRAALLKVRSDNLAQLREVALQKAAAAKEAGDLETEHKLRKEAEKTSILYQQVTTAQKQAFEAEQNALDRDLRERLARREGKTQGTALKRARIEAQNMILDNARQDPDIKNYGVIRNMTSAGIDAYRAKNSAGDIMLMRAVARASDPNTGVREEEFRTFEGASGALMRRGVQLTAGMVGKGRLSDSGRQALLQQLMGLESRYRTPMQAKYESLGSIADEAELDRQQVLPEIGFRSTKAQILREARTGNWYMVALMVRDTPELNDDPEIERITRKAVR